jgi:hypothetical protein
MLQEIEQSKILLEVRHWNTKSSVYDNFCEDSKILVEVKVCEKRPDHRKLLKFYIS